jgi:serine protease
MDNNGYVDDANGYDFANDDDSVYDRHPISGGGDEHGTHVAGTIAAGANNGTGVNGVGWRIRIMPLKFLGADGQYTSNAIEAINYATNKNFGVK